MGFGTLSLVKLSNLSWISYCGWKNLIYSSFLTAKCMHMKIDSCSSCHAVVTWPHCCFFSENLSWQRKQIKIPVKENMRSSSKITQQHQQLLTDIVIALRKNLQFSVILFFGSSGEQDNYRYNWCYFSSCCWYAVFQNPAQHQILSQKPVTIQPTTKSLPGLDLNCKYVFFIIISQTVISSFSIITYN